MNGKFEKMIDYTLKHMWADINFELCIIDKKKKQREV